MAKFILEVEEGSMEDCEVCPFNGLIRGECACTDPEIKKLDCRKYDLTTLKITKQE